MCCTENVMDIILLLFFVSLLFFGSYAIYSKHIIYAVRRPYFYFYILGSVLNILFSPLIFTPMVVFILIWHFLFCSAAANLYGKKNKCFLTKSCFVFLVLLFLFPCCITVSTFIFGVPEFGACHWLLPLSTFDPIQYVLFSFVFALLIAISNFSLFNDDEPVHRN